MIVVGCDISLTHFGTVICKIRKRTRTIKPIYGLVGGQYTSTKGCLTGLKYTIERYPLAYTPAIGWHISQIIVDHIILAKPKVDLVVIEDYPYAVRSCRLVQYAEVVGAIKAVLYEARIPWQTVNPITLKKISTGNARASKEDMIAAADRLGLALPDVLSPSDRSDLADAFLLAAYALSFK